MPSVNRTSSQSHGERASARNRDAAQTSAAIATSARSRGVSGSGAAVTVLRTGVDLIELPVPLRQAFQRLVRRESRAEPRRQLVQPRENVRTAESVRVAQQ